MSSWIVNDSVINSVIELIQESDNFDNLKTKLVNLKFYGDSWKIDWKKFGQALLDMNYEAVNQRYNEKEKASKFKLKSTDFDIYQKIKNLHCLHYQCMEGNIPETNLFKFIEELDYIIESSIISSNQLYEKAKWGTE